MQKAYFRYINHVFGRKTLIIAILLVMVSWSAKAQLNYLEYANKKLYFGITIGVNLSSFKVFPSDKLITDDSINVVTSSSGPGFNLGIVSNLKIGKYFDLRLIPALSFADKQLDYELTTGQIVTKSIDQISLEFPLQIRFKSQPIKDIRIYVLFGMKYNLDLASNAKARKAEDQVTIARHDLAYEYGIGIQFFFPLFIFSPELKFSHGINDIHSLNSNLGYSNVLDKLLSRSILISLHFEG